MQTRAKIIAANHMNMTASTMMSHVIVGILCRFFVWLGLFAMCVDALGRSLIKSVLDICSRTHRCNKNRKRHNHDEQCSKTPEWCGAAHSLAKVLFSEKGLAYD
ncbi:hypothetical protein D1222_01920 [Henriciella algicola]|uniref:Uncharacterized protein n=1 Tax=Henriciella algicola TaxID=1608422 RepID=A0A399RHD2_9PROT|nr:hypothetical protein D1222_01920 [Henriciella algicola]